MLSHASRPHYGGTHGLCNAHHLPELTFIQEHYGHASAKKCERLLILIKRAVDKQQALTGQGLWDKQKARYQTRYMNILHRGRKECRVPAETNKATKGRIKRTQALNLLNRLMRYHQYVLAFMYNPAVPFDNNQAERDIRMMKVQQKISGCFRTARGAEQFCRIRGYISTAKKQGCSVLHSLQNAFDKQPILFNA